MGRQDLPAGCPPEGITGFAHPHEVFQDLLVAPGHLRRCRRGKARRSGLHLTHDAIGHLRNVDGGGVGVLPLRSCRASGRACPETAPFGTRRPPSSSCPHPKNWKMVVGLLSRGRSMGLSKAPAWGTFSLTAAALSRRPGLPGRSAGNPPPPSRSTFRVVWAAVASGGAHLSNSSQKGETC